MFKFVFLATFSSIILAEDVAIFFDQHQGKSSYAVESLDKTLKSELLFPFKLNAIGLSFGNQYHDFDYTIKAAALADGSITTGKDYDWQNNNLTVFSTSNTKIDRFYQLGLELSKNIDSNISVVANAEYRQLNLSWLDTRQQDFVTDTLLQLKGETLQYQQKFYQLNLGLNYQYSLGNNFDINFKPELIAARIQSKDLHLLRDFYTLQKNTAIGYGLGLRLDKTLENNHIISAIFDYENYQDKDNKLHYYNTNSGRNYRTLPASYQYNNRIFSIHYQAKF